MNRFLQYLNHQAAKWHKFACIIFNHVFFVLDIMLEQIWQTEKVLLLLFHDFEVYHIGKKYNPSIWLSMEMIQFDLSLERHRSNGAYSI